MNKPKFFKKNVFFDKRGVFAPLSLETIEKRWIQSNISVNKKKYTLRGLHYQYGITSQSKLIKVINGKILDFIIDLREYSPDYNKVQFFLMEPGDELFVPFEFAHGFITLEDNTIVQYLVDNEYNPESERCILWSTIPEIEKTIIEYDKNFNKNDLLISDKDLIHNP